MEDIRVCFYSTTAPAVSGQFFNAYNSGLSAGLLDSDLNGYDTDVGEGVSLTLGSARTVSTNGRNDGTPLVNSETNRQGAYHTGTNYADTFGSLTNVTSTDVLVYLCTDFDNQDDLEIDVNGTVQSNWDSSGNTTGAILTFSGIAPNGSDQIIIDITNNSVGAAYILCNGYALTNIIEGAAGGGSSSKLKGKFGGLLTGKF